MPVVKDRPQNAQSVQTRISCGFYATALVVSIALWFIAIHAPLRQDETGSWWVVKDGFLRAWIEGLHSLTFPTYFSILWLSTKILGTSEIALRIPSILAMLGAVWLLYLAARELFSRELALLATIIFCLHPIVVFTSIDVRPYAFAVLATNAAMLVLLRMRRSDSMELAALFGLLAAAIISFHYLFAVILPAFVVCFFVIKTGSRKTMWRQFGVAAAVFALAFLPMVPGLQFLFHTAGSHVYKPSTPFVAVIWTLVPGPFSFVFGGAMLLAALWASFRPNRNEVAHKQEAWRILTCAALALIPLFILYGVSAGTTLHIFVFQHELSVVPGLALCWAWLIERYLKTRPVRLLFCLALAAATAIYVVHSPFIRDHSFSRKYALEAAEKNASADNAPVLICSGFVESKYVPMPIDPKTSRYFAPLSYYKLTVPVVPLPWGLNDEAKRVGSQFLKEAAQKHQRFLIVASDSSYDTLDWLSQQASPNYNVRSLGTFETVTVLEFDPRVLATRPGGRASGQPSRPFAKAASTPATP